MLKLSEAILNRPVLSLRTGGPIGTATKVIFNPNNLQVEGWYVTDKFDNTQLILVANEVREIIEQGIVVNDHEVLSPIEDLVRLKPIIELNFEIIGKSVTTESGKKLGKVSDYAIESSGLMVKKIYASQPLVKNLTGGTLSIDRTQIIEITNRRIVVEDTTEKMPAGAVVSSPAV